MAGCGLFRAGRELAKVPLTGRNQASAQVADFAETGFSNLSGIGSLPPTKSGIFVKPAGSSGFTFTDASKGEGATGHDARRANHFVDHRQRPVQRTSTHAHYAQGSARASAA
jgi:hypothetical protein